MSRLSCSFSPWERVRVRASPSHKHSLRHRRRPSPQPSPRGRGAKTVTHRADLPRTRAEFLSADGVLLVVRETPPAPSRQGPAHSRGGQPDRRRRDPARRVGRRQRLGAQRARRSGHRHPDRTRADRGGGTRPRHALRAHDARRHCACAQPGRDDCERLDPDPFAAAAPGRRAGACVAARACGRTARRGHRRAAGAQRRGARGRGTGPPCELRRTGGGAAHRVAARP
jgi:hypothetical protein